MFAQEDMTRREFVQAAAVAAGGAVLLNSGRALGQPKGERPFQAADVKVLNPQNRVPMSFIIDDSTCLVNLAYFGIPQLPRYGRTTTSRIGASCRVKSRIPSFVSSASGAARTASRANTASFHTRPASAGSTEACRAGRESSLTKASSSSANL